MSRILVSLGGNALGTDFDELVESVGVVAKPIVGLIQAGHEIVICHGNGPQVGMIKTSIDHGRASYQQFLVPRPWLVHRAGTVQRGHRGVGSSRSRTSP